jgi:hypothetical protein
MLAAPFDGSLDIVRVPDGVATIEGFDSLADFVRVHPDPLIETNR